MLPRRFYSPLALSIYVVLLILPLMVSFQHDLKTRPFIDDLASSLAILAMTMMMLEFLLSGRFKTLSAPIGMDAIMRFHQFIGRLILLMICIHPLLYSLPYNKLLPWDASRSLSLQMQGLSAGSALLALLLITLLVVFAIIRKNLSFRYEQWRMSHLLLSIVVIVLGLLHAFESGRYTQFTGLAIFWFAGILVIVMALLHVYLVVPFIQSRNPYRIDRLERLTDNTWQLNLLPTGRHPDFLAGQFVWLKFGRPFFNLQEHPFSISSCPSQPQLEFTIKSLGDFTSQLDRLDTRLPVYLDGPHGHFTLQGRDASGIMLIAGGIGIAPIMSIVRDLAAHNDKRPVILLNCCRNQQHLVYQQELAQLQSQLPLQVIHLLSSPTPDWQGKSGRVDIPLLQSLFASDYQQWCYFLCGPPAMMDCIETMLLSQQIPGSQIISERFSYEYKRSRS